MLIANFIFFQLAWFSCVAGGAYGIPWFGVAITFAILGWHLSQAKSLKLEMLLIFLAIIIGLSFDQLMLTMQWIEYKSHGWNDALVPVWILALWGAFASTLNLSLAWLQGKYLIAIVLGSLAGPLAYIGAEKIGAVTLHGSISYIFLAIGWSILTPLLLYFAKQLNGFKAGHI